MPVGYTHGQNTLKPRGMKLDLKEDGGNASVLPVIRLTQDR